MQISAKSETTPRLARVVLLLGAALILYGAASEFYGVASGTGAWLGQMSLKWALAFGLFVVFCFVCLALGAVSLWSSRRLVAIVRASAGFRGRLGLGRYILALAFALLPVWFLQYSPWGVVFSKVYVRLLIWALSCLLISFFVEEASDRATSATSILSGLLISGVAFALATPLMGVTSYPFSLSWSEGNRLWDYSLLFGLHLYQLPPNSQPSAYLDLGRQLAGGLPFLLPHVSIVGERLWLAALSVVPYVVLGLLMFWPSRGGSWQTWILAGLWGFLFLNQGPIHTPLLVVAALVAIAWRLPKWPAAFLVALAAYIAEVSRFTWIFAAPIWAVMLDLGGADLEGNRIPRRAWERSITLGIAGLFGGALAIVSGLAPGGTSITATAAASTKQPLLWYRLFPNATYGHGILLGLLIASGPLILLLVLMAVRHWHRNWLQVIALAAPLAAFLAVGLIISTKIGGGGDLHNVDMFLIGLLFFAAAFWKAGGDRRVLEASRSSAWLNLLLAALIAIPAFQPLMEMRPISFAQDAGWLAVLADVAKPRDLGSLPGDSEVTTSLQDLQKAVAKSQDQGPVLFMDQRQLLTFGYIKNVQLLPDYEKKRMMDEALSGSVLYFQPFYQDLSDHRFALIISSPLRTPIRDSEYGFGEENNAWVKWVAKPVLCYYTELDTLTDVKVEMLVPRTAPQDCSDALP